MRKGRSFAGPRGRCGAVSVASEIQLDNEPLQFAICGERGEFKGEFFGRPISYLSGLRLQNGLRLPELHLNQLIILRNLERLSKGFMVGRRHH